MEELIDAIKAMDPDFSKPCNILMNKNYSPILIDKNNFHPIKDTAHPESKHDAEITFVDGGQSILFEGAGFCIGLIRVAGITYKCNKRVSRELIEFTVFVQENDGKLFVKTSPKNEFDGMVFDPEDESIRSGTERATCSRIIPIIRRLAELRTASKFRNPILDGTLEARYPYEVDYIKNLKNPSALAKTCSLTTNMGLGITDYLSLMDGGSWYYHPIVKNNNKSHNAEIYFVKLNERSDYVFRFENNGDDAHEIISLLKKNSIDPVFLGYPYGLIDADHSARVSEQEKKALQTKISMKLGKDWNRLYRLLKSMNAHDVLDNIKF